MESSVELQAPMAFQHIWAWLAAILIITAVFLQVFFRVRRARAGQVPKKIRIRKPPAALLPQIKEKYLRELFDVEGALGREDISVREAFQRLSAIIRGFVYEVTGIRVQNYTLYEIRQLNIKRLTKLIEEYYTPEFARTTRMKGFASIERTRGVISRWY